MPAKAAEVATPVRRATEDDLRAVPDDGRKHELVDGQLVVAYRSPSDVRELSSGDDLDGEDVVPGFRCRLEDILR